MYTHMMPHHQNFVKAIAWALRQRCGVATRSSKARRGDAPDRLLLAVSGGADSVALLRALHRLSQRRRSRLALSVGHVQHHLRPQAESDAQFVSELAQQLGLPFLRADVDLSQAKGNLENAARAARYRALTAMARSQRAAYIVTAHHADDQLETMLMRWLRGTSVTGLSAMAWRRRLRIDPRPSRDDASASCAPTDPGHPAVQLWLIRPMLAVDRAMVRPYLDGLGQRWQEDHTNADCTRTRARLRHDVIPHLAAIRPDACHRSVALADHFHQLAQLLDDAIAQAHRQVVHEDQAVTLDRQVARQLPKVVLSGLIRRLLLEAGAHADCLSARTLESIRRAICDPQGTSRRFELSAHVVLTVDKHQIRVLRNPSTG